MTEMKCETCGGLCEVREQEAEIKDGIITILPPLRSIAAERAELEAWERHCPECQYHDFHDGNPLKKFCAKLMIDRKPTFDACPLRPKNVPSQDGQEETEEV